MGLLPAAEAVVSLEGASARLVSWNPTNAERTLESLLPRTPPEGGLVIVAVVDGSIESAPAEPLETTVHPATRSPEPTPQVDPDSPELPTLHDTGFQPDPQQKTIGYTELTVEIPKGVYATGIEVVCDDVHYRQRARFDGIRATLDDVPVSECRITFKGGTVMSAFSGHPGNYACRSLGPTALACQSKSGSD